jgi:hypothetical protein
MDFRRGLTISLIAVSLMSACGDGDDGGGGGTGDSGGGTGSTTGSAGEVWMAAISRYVDALNEYAQYYRGEYRGPLPDDVTTDNERIAYLTDLQRTLLSKLDPAVQLHEQLDPALENAIAQAAIPSEDVSDLRQFVDLTAEWLAIQLKVVERSLECFEGDPNNFAAVLLCVQGPAIANQPRIDELAAKIDKIAGRQFGIFLELGIETAPPIAPGS